MSHLCDAYLADYVAALARGWSSDISRGVAAATEELARINLDPVAFLASMDDREAKGPRIKLSDGSTADRLPGFQRWMWDGEFAGNISLRWRPGTTISQIIAWATSATVSSHGNRAEATRNTRCPKFCPWLNRKASPSSRSLPTSTTSRRNA